MSFHSLKLLTVLLFISGILNAQIHSKDISKIRLDFRGGKVIVKYDFSLNKQQERASIDLMFCDKDFNCILPSKLSGDIGQDVTIGKDKTIIWDFASDFHSMPDRMKPLIIPDRENAFLKHGKGPESALYSLLIPGLGDSRVKDPRDMFIKPYMRTILVYGLIGTGILSADRRVITPYYREYENGYDSKPIFHPKKTDYWLFPYDAEFLIGTGALLWISDVFWVTAHGRINQKVQKVFNSKSGNFSLSGHGPGLMLTF